MKKSTKTILSLILLCLLPLATNAQSNMKGDANADGVINATDVVEIISYIHGKPSPTFNKDNADLNKDGIVDERERVILSFQTQTIRTGATRSIW